MQPITILEKQFKQLSCEENSVASSLLQRSRYYYWLNISSLLNLLLPLKSTTSV